MEGGMQDRMKEAVDRIIRTLGPRRLMREMKGQHKTHLDQTYQTNYHQLYTYHPNINTE